MALLSEGPRHGYQLKTEFEAATGGVWPLNVGQVYTTLDRLERDGLVEVGAETAGAAGQKTYAITIAGTQALGEWWEAVPSDDPPPRDELMLKVMMAIEAGPQHALRDHHPAAHGAAVAAAGEAPRAPRACPTQRRTGRRGAGRPTGDRGAAGPRRGRPSLARHLRIRIDPPEERCTDE